MELGGERLFPNGNFSGMVWLKIRLQVFKQKGGDKEVESSIKARKDRDHKGKDKSKMYRKE